MQIPEILTKKPKESAFLAGVIFLFVYWLFAYDGITFSDDVYYLLAGRDFWNGTMEFNSYHFSTRWGAYVPSGLVGVILGFDAHRISLISLLAYIGTLGMLLKILPQSSNAWILVIWFSTQVYFLHFLTKVYPDSLLVFWTVLVPFSAVYRGSRPVPAAFGVIAGLFFGFLTKETIVFLAPFPVMLFLFDWKNGKLDRRFYVSLLTIGFLFGGAYLGYFWIKFGHPLYRFQSIQEGHYISEFTYADKSIWVMLKRLTILPILTFVERSYWLWMVFAIPALVRVRKNPATPGTEFGLAFLSLLVCFWFMSTNFKFYNPLYLNPRHLIILVPILAFLICMGWREWQSNPKLRWAMIVLILFGVMVSLVAQDWKMAGFQAIAALLIFPKSLPYRNLAFAVLLLIPAVAAPIFHQKTKNYPLLIHTLEKELNDPEAPQIILTHSFINFSKAVMFPGDLAKQDRISAFEKLDSLQKVQPEEFTVVVYRFYEKAYPEEQSDLDALALWLNSAYIQTKEFEDGLVQVRTFQKK